GRDGAPARGRSSGSDRLIQPLRLADLAGLALATLETVASALHSLEELLEVDLERREDVVGVVLGAEADFALALAGLLDDLLGGTLGLAGDLLVRDEAGLLLAGLLDDPLGLTLGLGE